MKAAEYLRNDILTFTIENDIYDSITWSPTVSLLEERKPPAMLCNFLSNILKKSRDTITPEKTQQLIDSLAADIISGVTNGKFLTAKHFLLSMVLHSLSGSRYVIDILNKLGHCMPYKLTCEIETSQAEIAEKILDESQKKYLMTKELYYQ